MAKIKKTSVFTASAPPPETPIDKTTRIVRKIVDSEAEKRNSKSARLRKARLEREAGSPPKQNGTNSKASPKKGGKR